MDPKEIKALKRAISNLKDYVLIHPEHIWKVCEELADYSKQVAAAYQGSSQKLLLEIQRDLLNLKEKSKKLVIKNSQNEDNDEDWYEEDENEIDEDEMDEVNEDQEIEDEEDEEKDPEEDFVDD